ACRADTRGSAAVGQGPRPEDRRPGRVSAGPLRRDRRPRYAHPSLEGTRERQLCLETPGLPCRGRAGRRQQARGVARNLPLAQSAGPALLRLRRPRVLLDHSHHARARRPEAAQANPRRLRRRLLALLALTGNSFEVLTMNFRLFAALPLLLWSIALASGQS